MNGNVYKKHKNNNKEAGQLIDLKERACQKIGHKGEEVAEFLQWTSDQAQIQRHINSLIKK